jgi:phosphoglycolate phosphatase-like HAD superfamily hydrolase
MLRLITDFDGPIMDVSERYYQVYLHCLGQVRRSHQPIQILSKPEFWDLKRAQVPERQIGHQSGLDTEQADRFAQLRRQTVHSLSYLPYDRLLPQAKANLQFLQQQGIDLVVMTMRRVRELNAAFEQYNLGGFFPENRRYCLADDYVKTTDVEDKPRLMARALAELPAATETWMVGDTEADIIAAQRHQIPVIAVLSGIRDRERLAFHSPDRIVDSLEAAIAFILEKSAVLS